MSVTPAPVGKAAIVAAIAPAVAADLSVITGAATTEPTTDPGELAKRMLEKVARALAEADGQKPDRLIMGEPVWKSYVKIAAGHIAAFRIISMGMADVK